MITSFLSVDKLTAQYLSVSKFQSALDSVISGGAVMARLGKSGEFVGVEIQIPDDADISVAENAIISVSIAPEESDAAKEQTRLEKYSEFSGDKVFDALADLRRRVETLELAGGGGVKQP